MNLEELSAECNDKKVNFFQLEGIYFRSCTVTDQKGGRGGGLILFCQKMRPRGLKSSFHSETVSVYLAC